MTTYLVLHSIDQSVPLTDFHVKPNLQESSLVVSVMLTYAAGFGLLPSGSGSLHPCPCEMQAVVLSSVMSLPTSGIRVMAASQNELGISPFSSIFGRFL